ncbi:MAG TPA: hypothetical protein VFP10_15235 [Candidatus Eisenbacteria bacterium]|nr:hypothetical protein [Candidatus Eisenbacteria bacterium]
MEPKRVRGSRVVMVSLVLVLAITTFIVLRMVQSVPQAPATAPHSTGADSIR